MRFRLAALCAVSALAMAASAHADSLAITRPNTTTSAGPVTVSFGGFDFVNQGLVGTARIPSNLLDFNGDTLGSFSSMAVDRYSWHKNADGSYGGGLYTLPDRGPNNVGGLTTTDYAARLNHFNITFNPYTGTASVNPATTQQMQMTQSGGFLLTGINGQVFTGVDPGSAVQTIGGIQYPVVASGQLGAGKIAIDSEGLIFLNDGTFYVSDEYAATLYYFDKTGHQIGAIQAGPDILPTVNGVVNLNGVNDSPLIAGSTGRRSNQGMEGVSVSPDGHYLYSLLQSATLQDNPTNAPARRNNTRMMVYDISGSKTPTTPVAEYVMQLPVYNSAGLGGAPNATAAQSELLALNDHQFLVLSRDADGRGTDLNTKAVVFKSIMLVDTDGATNIAGTPFATGTTPISTTADANGAGALVPSITPVAQTELVNMLNTTQLSKFGIDLSVAPPNRYALSEKWEAMSLLPTLDEAHPQDFFLLIGNDNDFVSNSVTLSGSPTVQNVSTALTSFGAAPGDPNPGNNDNQIFTYRLTLPTYADPMALQQMQIGFRLNHAAIDDAAAGTAGAAASAPIAQLDSARYAVLAGQAFGQGSRVWSQNDYSQRRIGPGYGQNTGSISLGADAGFGGMARLGAYVTGGETDGPDRTHVESYGAGVHGAIQTNGFYAEGSIGVTKLSGDYYRPAAYQQVAHGDFDGRVSSGEVQVGYEAPMAGGLVGPYAAYSLAKGWVGSIRETDASLSNVYAPKQDIERSASQIGLEASAPAGGLVAVGRLGYEWQNNSDDNILARLRSVAGTAGMATLSPFDNSQNGLFLQTSLESDSGPFSWRINAQAKDNDGHADIGVGFGVSQSF